MSDVTSELGKPTDDEPWAIARKIHDDVKSSECFNPFNSAVMIQQYAEAYHAARCKEESAAIIAASDRLGAALEDEELKEVE